MKKKIKEGLKKYALFIVFVLAIIPVHYILFPACAADYLESDVESLQEKHFYLILGLELLVFCLCFLRGIIKMKGGFARMVIIVMLAVHVFLFFTIFRDIYCSVYLSINKTETNKTDLQIYRVMHKYNYSLKQAKLTLVRLAKKEEVILARPFRMSRSQYESLKVGSTIFIEFKKGKLGIPYSPKILPFLTPL